MSGKNKKNSVLSWFMVLVGAVAAVCLIYFVVTGIMQANKENKGKSNTAQDKPAFQMSAIRPKTQDQSARINIIAGSDQDKAKLLTSNESLLKMVLLRMRRSQAPAMCLNVAAISYRLAEARDLKISKPSAIDLASDPSMVGALAEKGINPNHVVTQLADIIYNSQATPAVAFNSELDSCKQKAK